MGANVAAAPALKQRDTIPHARRSDARGLYSRTHHKPLKSPGQVATPIPNETPRRFAFHRVFYGFTSLTAIRVYSSALHARFTGFERGLVARQHGVAGVLRVHGGCCASTARVLRGCFSIAIR